MSGGVDRRISVIRTDRKCKRIIDVVDHHVGLDLGVHPSSLYTSFGLPENGCHLRARIRRRDADLVQASADADCLAEPGRGTSSDCDDAVREHVLCVFDRALGDVRRGVHRRLTKDAGNEGQQLCNVLALLYLLRRREQQRPAEALRRQLPGQLGDDARAKDDTAWVLSVRERG